MYDRTQQEYKPPDYVLCRRCDKPIFLGDRTVYVHHGILGRGRKSGSPIVVDDDMTSGEAVICELCAVSHMVMNVVDSSEEAEGVVDTLTADLFGVSYSELVSQEQLCANCEARIDDE